MNAEERQWAAHLLEYLSDNDEKLVNVDEEVTFDPNENIGFLFTYGEAREKHCAIYSEVWMDQIFPERGEARKAAQALCELRVVLRSRPLTKPDPAAPWNHVRHVGWEARIVGERRTSTQIVQRRSFAGVRWSYYVLDMRRLVFLVDLYSQPHDTR